MRKRLLVVVLALTFCFACSSSEEDDDAGGQMPGDGTGGLTGTGGTTGDGGSAGSKEVAPGGSLFWVELNPALPDEGKNTATISGHVCDAPKLAYRMVVKDVTQEKEGCKLLEPRIPFCDPPCEYPSECVEDYVCASERNCFDAGSVDLKGLRNEEGKETISLSYIGEKYPGSSAALLYPPFAEGDPVILEAEGAQVEAFTIESRGIAPLEVLTTDGLLLDRDKPVTIEWTAATIADNSRINITVDISHHGGLKGIIECDVADTGSLEIPADLITGLLDLGYAGYPKVDIERFALGSTTFSLGRIDLRVSSRATRYFEIQGLVSCPRSGTAEGCPEGQICQDDLSCR